MRRALRAHGVDVERLALRWVVAVPECRLEAPGAPVLDDTQLWDGLALGRLADMYRRSFGPIEVDCLTGGGPPVRYVAADHDRVVARSDEVAAAYRFDELAADLARPEP